MKKLLYVLLGSAGLMAGLFLCLSVAMAESLYIPNETNQELIDRVFKPGFPGYSSVTILEVDGEGVRKIPRTMRVEVQIDSYPQPVTCQAELRWVIGGPMAVDLAWETLACAGQGLFIELAQAALDDGLERTDCHAERVGHLLADWASRRLISLEGFSDPDTRLWLEFLAQDPESQSRLPALDGGLFATNDLVRMENAIRPGGPDQRSSYVLRCDGSLEQYRIDPGHLNTFVEVSQGDHELSQRLVDH